MALMQEHREWHASPRVFPHGIPAIYGVGLLDLASDIARWRREERAAHDFIDDRRAALGYLFGDFATGLDGFDAAVRHSRQAGALRLDRRGLSKLLRREPEQQPEDP